MYFTKKLARTARGMVLSAAVLTVMGTPQASLAALPAVNSGATGNVPLNTVYKADQIQRFMQAAGTRRVDIAGIGDSNQLAAQDYGHDHGFGKAWGNAYGMYASEVSPSNAKGAYAILGVDTYVGVPYSSDQFDPALPQQYKDLSMDPKVAGSPASAGYIPAGSSSSNGATIYVTPKSPFFDATHTMKWHSTFWQFPDAGGDFTPQLRGDGGKYGTSTLQTYPTVNIPAAPLGNKVDYSLSINPSLWTQGADKWKLFLYDYNAQQNDGGPSGAMNGQLYSVSQRVEDADRTKGISYTTLLYQGGLCARDAAISLKNGTDASIAEWMRQMTKLQNVPGAQAMMMVQIEHGGNDRGQTLPSVGLNPAPSNTAAGFKDNLEAIVTRLRQVWTASGYDAQNLFFNIGPYHQQQDHIAELANLETGAMALADSTYNVSVTRGSKMLSALSMKRNNYYLTAEDDAHLNQQGYEAIGRLAVNQLTSTLPHPDGADRSDISRLSFQFTGDASAIAPSDLTLTNLTGNFVVAPADMSVTYDPSTLTAEFTFPGLAGLVLVPGQYQATLNAPGANLGAGQAPGAAGDYTFTFTANPIPEPASLFAAGGLLIGAMTRRKRASIR